jgi:drug/metabolite transporter (DMT)-like permease
LHASWNFLAKRAGDSPGFVWLFNALATMIYVPGLFILFIVERSQLNWFQVIFLLGSGCLYLAYYSFLQRGYASGDLSLSYPLARGTGPLISTLLAIALLGERPSVGALGGIALLIGGVIFLVGNPWQLFAEGKGKRSVIGYALLTGVFIAAYTVWDKEAVSTFLISPFLLSEASSVFLTGLLLPVSIKHWSRVKKTWSTHRLEVLGVAILSPLAYLLILFVLISNPVSQVAPLRESSVLIGTFMGTQFLAEKRGWRRIGAAGLILAGIVLLAVSP